MALAIDIPRFLADLSRDTLRWGAFEAHKYHFGILRHRIEGMCHMPVRTVVIETRWERNETVLLVLPDLRRRFNPKRECAERHDLTSIWTVRAQRQDAIAASMDALEARGTL